MLKINSVAKGLINKSLASMVEMGILKAEEILYEVAEVKEEKVVFLIHDSLKKMIEGQLNAHKPQHASVSFDNYDSIHWHIIIENDGLESFFFSRQLQRLLEKSKGTEKKQRHIKSNIALIREAIADSIKKCGADPSKYTPTIEFKSRVYAVEIVVNGIPIKMDDAKIDMLLKKVSRDFPIFFKTFSEIKKVVVGDNSGIKVEVK